MSNLPLTKRGEAELHEISILLSQVASKIDEFGVSIVDSAKVSDLLFEKQGITLWKLRSICDEIWVIKEAEAKFAKEFLEEKGFR